MKIIGLWLSFIILLIYLGCVGFKFYRLKISIDKSKSKLYYYGKRKNLIISSIIIIIIYITCFGYIVRIISYNNLISDAEYFYSIKDYVESLRLAHEADTKILFAQKSNKIIEQSVNKLLKQGVDNIIDDIENRQPLSIIIDRLSHRREILSPYINDNELNIILNKITGNIYDSTLVMAKNSFLLKKYNDSIRYLSIAMHCQDTSHNKYDLNKFYDVVMNELLSKFKIEIDKRKYFDVYNNINEFIELTSLNDYQEKYYYRFRNLLYICKHKRGIKVPNDEYFKGIFYANGFLEFNESDTSKINSLSISMIIENGKSNIYSKDTFMKLSSNFQNNKDVSLLDEIILYTSICNIKGKISSSKGKILKIIEIRNIIEPPIFINFEDNINNGGLKNFKTTPSQSDIDNEAEKGGKEKFINELKRQMNEIKILFD
jgi:hypothetical protein